jgi:hypothetical protein
VYVSLTYYTQYSTKAWAFHRIFISFALNGAENVASHAEAVRSVVGPKPYDIERGGCMQQVIKRSSISFCLVAGLAGNACAPRALLAWYLNAAIQLSLAVGREVIP